MTLNKFCPVAQGEYYNIKSPDKSQLFFTYFFIFFCSFSVHFFISPTGKKKKQAGQISLLCPACFLQVTSFLHHDPEFSGLYLLAHTDSDFTTFPLASL